MYRHMLWCAIGCVQLCLNSTQATICGLLCEDKSNGNAFYVSCIYRSDIASNTENVNVHIRMRTHKHTQKHANNYIHTHTNIHMRIHKNTHTHTYIHLHTCACFHIYTYIHTYQTLLQNVLKGEQSLHFSHEHGGAAGSFFREYAAPPPSPPHPLSPPPTFPFPAWSTVAQAPTRGPVVLAKSFATPHPAREGQ